MPISVPRVVLAAKDGAPRRTDPRSFLAKGVAMLPSMAVPLAALAFSTRERMPLELLLPLALGAVLLTFAVGWAQWRRTTYRVGAADIRVESGLLSRSARSLPFERIQDVSLEQALVPRLLGLAEVRFETGAGGKDELALAFLPLAEGERLRDLVRERRDADAAAPGPEQVEEERVLFTMGPRRIALFGLFQFSLIVVAVVAGAVRQFEFLLPFDPWELGEWQRVLAGPGAWLAGLGTSAQVVGAMLAVAALLLVGTLSGLARTAAREWGFTLTRNAKGFRRQRGLFTRTDVVMPVHRVQAVGIATGPVRGRFGWHGAGFVSLATDGAGGNHQVAPFARMEEIAPIVAEAGFPLPPPGLDWRLLAPAHRVVAALRTFAGWLLAAGVLAAAQALLPPGWWSDPTWLLLPLLGGAARAAYVWGELRRERYGLDERLIYRRGGWLAPHLAVAAREKLHSVELYRGPVGKRLGYVTVRLGLAGGTFAIPAVPEDDAQRLRAALLESMTRRDFSAVD